MKRNALLAVLLALFLTTLLVVACGDKDQGIITTTGPSETQPLELTGDTNATQVDVESIEPGSYKRGAYISIAWPMGPGEAPSDWTGDTGHRTSGASGSYCGGTRSWTHSGADYYARDLNQSGWDDYKKKVYAGFHGRVVRARDMGDGYGKTVVIYDASRHVAIRYSHLYSIAVSKGQWVNIRQYIGRLGNSGNSTGPHLHLCAYENIDHFDDDGYPVIPNLCDSEYYCCAVYFFS